MKERLTIVEAAKILGVSRMTITLWLRSGKCPFGEAIHHGKDKNTGWTYLVWTKQLLEYAQERGVKL